MTLQGECTVKKDQNMVSKSIEFWERCRQVIPAGSSTLAKSPDRLAYGFSPFYAQCASGSHFRDIDGNEWLDCEMSMGTVVWGHCRAEVDAAMLAQIQKGVHFSIPSTLEFELAERILGRFPQYQAAKFFINGADAVYACVRAARFLSGRLMTLSCHYHGWLDWASPTYYHCAPQDLGIPNETLSHHISCYGGAAELLEQINANGEHLAAVVLCPANYAPEALAQILAVCRQKQIFTIFDEVTSGCRFAKGGATTAFALRPDYLCLSKGLANGLPLAVALGRADEMLVMERLKISSAHAGSHLSFAAALACEELLERAEVWPSWKPRTDEIMEEISAVLDAAPGHGLALSGSAGCFSVVTQGTEFLEDPFRQYMMRYLAKHRIFSKGYILFSDAHTRQEIDFTGRILMECIQTYMKANS